MELPETLRDTPLWRPMLNDGLAPSFADATEAFFLHAIEPSCVALALKVGTEPRGEERTNSRIDAWEAQRVAELEMHRSFALALGGLWERHFRQVLWVAAAIILGDQRQPHLKKVERDGWPKLMDVFELVRGFSMERFPMYEELEMLHQVSSAVRHGTGRASLWVYERRPDLFLKHDVRSGWFAYAALGGEEAHSINKLNVTLESLRRFKDAIVQFWTLCDQLRQRGASL